MSEPERGRSRAGKSQDAATRKDAGATLTNVQGRFITPTDLPPDFGDSPTNRALEAQAYWERECDDALSEAHDAFVDLIATARKIQRRLRKVILAHDGISPHRKPVRGRVGEQEKEGE